MTARWSALRARSSRQVVSREGRDRTLGVVGRRSARAFGVLLAGCTVLAAAGCGGSGSHAAIVSGPQLVVDVAAAGGSLTGLVTQGGVAEARLTVPIAATDGGGTQAQGWVSWPTGKPLSGLVVYGHGCCGVPAGWQGDAVRLEALTGTIVVAMDYRKSETYAPQFGAEDMAVADQVLRAAVPGISRTVAWGQSEGGAATAMLIQRHPGLVQDWVDQSGAVDLTGVLTQLQKDLAAGLTGAQALSDVAAAAVGTPPDPGLVAALSPARRPDLLKTLRQAVVVHGSGDLVVPVAQSITLAKALSAEGVDTQLRLVDPAPGQPTFSLGWHTATAIETQAAAAVRDALAGKPLTGGATVHSTATLG
jgi:hypothetical protein